MTLEYNNNQPSFWDHFEELRKVLIKVFLIIIVFTSIAFIFHKDVINSLSKSIQSEQIHISEIKTHHVFNTQKNPLTFSLPKNSVYSQHKGNVSQINDFDYVLAPDSYLVWDQTEPKNSLFILGPMEGFSVSLKVSLWLGIALSSPFWFYFILQFIMPALYQHEKALIFPFLILSLVFISLGLMLALYVTIPLANSYLSLFNADIGVNLWSLSLYIDYTLILLLANAIAFEFFAVLFLLIHHNIITKEMMINKRKFFILGAFIVGALLTPPDAISQLLLAIPLIVLYELLIVYAKVKTGAKKIETVLSR